MCGIVGIYSFEGAPPNRHLWFDLVNHLQHRGPDEGGWWADGPFFLGHRRLSIVDLEKGQQPMASPDGRYVVIFNGEIYNFIELKKKLKQRGYYFQTDSDTEVLLHGYNEWKNELPKYLTGMFAFAIADRRKKELFVARDRFGEKPLFIFRAPDYIAFASEIRPLASLPELSPSINLKALSQYLVLNYVPSSNCLLNGVERLQPATWRLFNTQEERSGKYWTLPDTPEQETPYNKNDVIEEFQRKFDRAISLNLRSDVPVGIFLSGGIDSALVAESAARQGKLNQAYCLDFQEASYREYSTSSMVAKKLGIPLERVVLEERDAAEFLNLVEHADDPLGDSSCLPVWVISKYAKQNGNKVVLGGDGGDEIFGGYITYRATLLHQRIITHLPQLIRSCISVVSKRLPVSEEKVAFSYKLWRFLRSANLPSGQAHFTWNGTWLPETAAILLKKELDRKKAGLVLSDLSRFYGLDENCTLFNLQKADIAEYLANDILVKVDRMGMGHSLEIRTPFLENELASWGIARPQSLKIDRHGNLKSLLRATAAHLFGDYIANRPKQGFSIPIHKWIRGPLREQVSELLSRKSLEQLEVLDPAPVIDNVNKHMSGEKAYGFELWGLAVMVAWYRQKIRNRPHAPLKFLLKEKKFPSC